MVDVNGVDSERLLSYVERVENVQEEIKGLQTDVKEIFQEAKSSGFDVDALRAVIKLRKMDEHEREAAEGILEVYKKALGME